MKFRTQFRPLETGRFVASRCEETGKRLTWSRRAGEVAVRSVGHDVPSYGLVAKTAYQTPEGWVYNAGGERYWLLTEREQ